MRLHDVAAASTDVAATSSRLAKTKRLAQLLAGAGADVTTVVAWLSGELPQRQIGVGYAALRSLPPAADAPSLTVHEVDARFDEIKATTGTGSQATRAALLADLFGRATHAEQDFLRRLLGGELRQGASAGVMADAVAKAFDAPLAAVRRAAMLGGSMPEVADALQHGRPLESFGLVVGRPVGPMLAQTAKSVDEALERIGGSAVIDAKLDGARVQVHRRGDDVTIYTRSLDDVTARLPEVVAAVRALPVESLVADGEAIALRPDGRPHPFQVTASRFGRSVDVDGAPGLATFLFDVLHLDGADLLDAPTHERIAVLDRIVPPQYRIDRIVTADLAEAQAFAERTLAAGHEGVMVKDAAAPYEAGRRGAGWIKVKPVHTLDLVVLAVEWGSGRRRGKLSNIHLGARDGDRLVMLGKTFKGMTDAMLDWQTERFLALADGPTDGWVVRVRPEQVVEIAFDGVQRSSRYPGGVALRFARVLRYRDDKTVAEIDTLATVRDYLPDGAAPD
ncbi:MAG: ATP-dependent DNA ligase [Jatrophihabitans sp.]|uniref:ATP-dependent DNA ligase n=1 Tax=Jatrophihabitans sp. TaxID=1932789 RepID=UPI003F805104